MMFVWTVGRHHHTCLAVGQFTGATQSRKMGLVGLPEKLIAS